MDLVHMATCLAMLVIWILFHSQQCIPSSCQLVSEERRQLLGNLLATFVGNGCLPSIGSLEKETTHDLKHAWSYWLTLLLAAFHLLHVLCAAFSLQFGD